MIAPSVLGAGEHAHAVWPTEPTVEPLALGYPAAARRRIGSTAPRGLVADVTPAAVAKLDLTPGRWVHFAVKAAEVQVYPCRVAMCVEQVSARPVTI
jgi:molybdate transport system ATP-binding protein